MRSSLSAILALVSFLALATKSASQNEADDVQAVVTTELGTFRIDFAPDKAPKHVEQFIKLTKEGYYDGSAFHRMTPNGLIQGGDPLLKDPKTPRNLWGTGGLNLLNAEPNDLKHERGTVSSVRTYKDGSDGAQFLICLTDLPGLNGTFTAFGRVTQGMDVVEKISKVPTAENTVAENPVRILKITIQPKSRR